MPANQNSTVIDPDAASAAKQPGFSVAGDPHVDVLTVQGVHGMLPLQIEALNPLLTLDNLGIEGYDTVDLVYVGITNNISTVSYSKSGALVATLTISYVGGVPSADNALVAKVVKS